MPRAAGRARRRACCCRRPAPASTCFGLCPTRRCLHRASVAAIWGCSADDQRRSPSTRAPAGSAGAPLDLRCCCRALALLLIGSCGHHLGLGGIRRPPVWRPHAPCHRHLIYLGLALVGGGGGAAMPVRFWSVTGWAWLFLGLALLALVLIPGIGARSTAAMRWMAWGRSTCRPRSSPSCSWWSTWRATWCAAKRRCAVSGRALSSRWRWCC